MLYSQDRALYLSTFCYIAQAGLDMVGEICYIDKIELY